MRLMRKLSIVSDNSNLMLQIPFFFVCSLITSVNVNSTGGQLICYENVHSTPSSFLNVTTFHLKKVIKVDNFYDKTSLNYTAICNVICEN